MRLKRLTLTAVLLACVAAVVVVTNWRALWLAVAYEKYENTSQRGFSGPVLMFTKRVEWLPGPDRWIPDQNCGYCNRDLHNICSADQEWLARRNATAKWHCTCPEASHEWNE